MTVSANPTSKFENELKPAPGTEPARPKKHFSWIEPRFAAIWAALGLMLVLNGIFLPRSVDLTTILSILPLAAFLTIAAIGQSLVIMSRGIDLSVPAIVSLSSAVLLGVSDGSNDRLWLGIGAAIVVAMLAGTVSGSLIAVLRLNALIVTLAVGSIVTGIGIWYRQNAVAESMVPAPLAEFASDRFLNIPVSVWLATIFVIGLSIILRKTIIGRRFELIGTSPSAAHLIGVSVRLYQASAYVVAAALYGVMAVLLSGFIRNPTLDVGSPYLLAPIAASVLGGTAISGGIGNFISVFGAAIFLTQLDQSLKMLGMPTAWQMMIQGLAIAFGMYISEMSSRRRIG
ncbi:MULTISPECIES: ABC transporter permease [unclassified Mesorhizobium]|uniref:ABC transporter permease n=1 Tax=unclassified Mesorhizobium TaxID=325217 RepID=UPI000463E18D|nr:MULTISPECIES: ABC transporter permease [unclassified Mesorhizobium]